MSEQRTNKLFLCQFCSTSFPRQQQLKRHVRKHTGEKPFPCTFPGCNKHFSRSDNRQQHLRSHYKKNEANLLLCQQIESAQSQIQIQRKLSSIQTIQTIQTIGCLTPSSSSSSISIPSMPVSPIQTDAYHLKASQGDQLIRRLSSSSEFESFSSPICSPLMLMATMAVETLALKEVQENRKSLPSLSALQLPSSLSSSYSTSSQVETHPTAHNKFSISFLTQ